MSKKFIADVITSKFDVTGVAASELAGDIIDAITKELITTGRFTIPSFGALIVRPTPKRTALNPKTGEKIAVKAGATVRFKASPNLREAAFAGMKKAKRQAVKAEKAK